MATLQSNVLSGHKPRSVHCNNFKPLLIYKPTDFRRFVVEKRLRTLREYSLFTKRSIKVQPRESMLDCALSVGTHFAGSNIDVLRLAIQDLGFNERRNFPECYDFYPATWFLPHQYDEWVSHMSAKETDRMTYIVKPSGGTQGKGIYLVQSPIDYCREQLIIHGLNSQNDDELPPDPAVCLGADAMGFLSAREVIQQYEDNPVLVNGYKADLRIYVVLESIKPLRIHIYRDGLVRLASQPYQTPGPMNMKNSKMHLTNYSINKFPDSVDPATVSQAETSTTSVSTTMPQSSGSHSDPENLEPNRVESRTSWQCKRRLHHLLQPGRLSKGLNLTPTTFWPRVDEMVRNTIFALVPYLRVAYWAECENNGIIDPITGKSKDPPQCFQIFGFDLLLVEPDCRPVLLEVNSSPSLRIDCMRPLVRYASAATRQGLSPDVVVNSPKYAAFFRSRVDEMVKLGLLKATLLLIGSRIIHQRLLRYSPEKAQVFLETCGYQIPPSLRIDISARPPVDAVTENKPQNSNDSPEQNHPQMHSTRKIHCSRSGNGWMSDRISRIYCKPNTRVSPWEERKRRRTLAPIAASAPPNPPPIPTLTGPAWPPLRCPPPNIICGKQRQSEKLSEYFLSQPLSSSSRKARNRLQCIYAEDEIYPTSTGIFGDRDKECSLNTSNIQKLPLPSSFPTFIPGEHEQSSPLPSEDLEKVNEFGTESPQYGLNRSQLTLPSVKSVEHLRIVDSLAEIFINVLSTRRSSYSHQKVLDTVEDRHISQRGHGNRSRSSNKYPFAAYVDPNGKTSNSHSSTTFSSNTEALPMADVPRMDFTSFRMFVQRCKLKALGISIREIDIIYMKHRLYWFRVFEPDSPEAETAFVELCSLIAQKCFTAPPDDANKELEEELQSPLERGKNNFINFVQHCSSNLKSNAGHSVTPKSTKMPPNSA